MDSDFANSSSDIVCPRTCLQLCAWMRTLVRASYAAAVFGGQLDSPVAEEGSSPPSSRCSDGSNP
eukprot:838215-Amphidinium_carterae.1